LVAPTSALSLLQRTAPPGDGASSPHWILIADDDDLVRGVLSDMLAQAGYRTIEARTGQGALDLMRVVVPDLIILDLRMPDLHGEQVMQHLGGSLVLRRLPVLIVSGFLDDEPPNSLGLNIVGRLPKPVRLRDLLHSVRTALDGRAHSPAPPNLPAVKAGEA
jgi:DNA-binding response OmpR family regulator